MQDEKKQCECTSCKLKRDGNHLKMASYMLEEVRKEFQDMKTPEAKKAAEFVKGFATMSEADRTEMVGLMIFSYNKLLLAREREKAIGDALAVQMTATPEAFGLVVDKPLRH